MKKVKAVINITIILILTISLSGCWNYREIEELSIVAGFAIDMTEDDNFNITVEVVSSGKSGKTEGELTPSIMEAEGPTLFEAIRSMISESGKKLYWSHTKIMVISKSVAENGLVPVLDWVNRDAEVREDIWVLVSKEKTAKEILMSTPKTENIAAFQINEALYSEKAISKYHATELWDILGELASESTNVVLPLVGLKNYKKEQVPKVSGSALFKLDKLIGYIDDEETMGLLWIKDQFEGGLFIVKNINNTNTNVTLEIHKSKTKLKPIIKGGNYIMDINIQVVAEIAEISSTLDVIGEKGRTMLHNTAEQQMTSLIEEVLEKFQREFEVDALGFGEEFRIRNYEAWKKSLGKNWEEIFPEVETKLKVHLVIRGSATRKKAVEVKE